MVLEILTIGFGGTGFAFFIAYCCGGNWSGRLPQEHADEALRELQNLDR